VRRALAPVRALLEAGVNVAVAGHLIGAETLPLVTHMVTSNAARAIGLADRGGLVVGKQADLVVLETRCLGDAVIDVPERRWVVKKGRITVTNELPTTFHCDPSRE
jgi:cytosine/creatinine deaminase